MDMNDPLYQHMSDELAVWRGIGQRIRDGWELPDTWPLPHAPYYWSRRATDDLGGWDNEPMTPSEAHLIYGYEKS